MEESPVSSPIETPTGYGSGKTETQWETTSLTGSPCPGKNGAERKEEETSKNKTDLTEKWEVVKSPARSHNIGISLPKESKLVRKFDKAVTNSTLRRSPKKGSAKKKKSKPRKPNH